MKQQLLEEALRNTHELLTLAVAVAKACEQSDVYLSEEFKFKVKAQQETNVELLKDEPSDDNHS
jgi:hypothetical protein